MLKKVLLTFLLLTTVILYLAFIHKLNPQDQPQAVQFGQQYELLPTIPSQDYFLSEHTVYITDPVRLTSPQDVDAEQTGVIYSGLGDGSVVMIQNGEIKVLAKMKGRILGIAHSLDRQNLIFITSEQGLCQMNFKTKEITVLLGQRNGKKFGDTTMNSFAQAMTRKIYFTESTDQFGIENYMKDILRSQPRGSLYEFDPKTKKVQLIYSGLYFANGIVVEEGEQSVLIAQTTKYRIKRIWIVGPKRGQSQILIDNLPGTPDNIKLNYLNQLWVAIPAWRDSLSEYIFSGTRIRRIIIALGLELHFERFANSKFAGGVKIDTKTGQIVEYLLGSTSRINTVTTILQKNGYIYVSSLKSPTIAIIDHHYINDQKIMKKINPEQAVAQDL